MPVFINCIWIGLEFHYTNVGHLSPPVQCAPSSANRWSFRYRGSENSGIVYKSFTLVYFPNCNKISSSGPMSSTQVGNYLVEAISAGTFRNHADFIW